MTDPACCCKSTFGIVSLDSPVAAVVSTCAPSLGVIGLPLRSHVTFGLGYPSIFVSNTAASPCFTSCVVGLLINSGDSTKYQSMYILKTSIEK